MGNGLRTRMETEGTPSPRHGPLDGFVPPRWLRRLHGRLLVDRALQFNLVTRTVILVLFVFAVLNATLFAPFTEEIRKGVPQDPAVIQSLLGLHRVIWPTAGFCLLVAVASALFLSHRIAGPLVRVKHAMREIEAGTLPEGIETRPRDYFKDEVRMLNRMVEGLRTQLEEIEMATATVDHAIDEGAARAAGDPETQRAFAKVHRHNGAVRRKVAGWLKAADGNPGP